MIIDSIFMWLVAVPLTFLAAYVFKLPPIWIYFIMTLDEFEKMPVVFIHYFRNKQTDTQTTDAGTDTADTQSADGTADTQAADGTAGEGESGQ